MELIKVQNLTVKYGDRLILDNINFSVSSGEIFMILGGSGSGKTTLLDRIIGLYEPDSGKIFIDGDDFSDSAGENRIKILKKIGVLYQSCALFKSMTVLENICLPLEELTKLPVDAIKAIAKNKLSMVGLGNFENFVPSELSYGMQKRVALARAMSLDPKILFLDEPSSGLDPITSSQLDNLILMLSKTLGITFVIVSHELPSIYKIATRVIILNDHKIVDEGIPEYLRYNSKNVFVKNFFDRKS